MRPDEHGRSTKEAVSPFVWALRSFVVLWTWSTPPCGRVNGLLLSPQSSSVIIAPSAKLRNAVVVKKERKSSSSSSSCWNGRLVDPYMLERNVTIRSVSWDTPPGPPSGGDSGTALLQIYHGAAVAPVHKLHDRTRTSIQTLFTKLMDGDWDEDDNGNVDAAVQQSGLDLSHSSRSRLQLWPTLSPTARDQLQSKIMVEARATQSIDPAQALHILYVDEHICVVNKPSGILAVPGSRRNPSLATAVFDLLQPYHTLDDMDQMVVHRLDMDTSGILVFALTVPALQQLHSDFRDRRVQKSYQALLAGHYRKAETTEIDVALERDPHHPPFMRIAQPKERVLLDPTTTTTTTTTTAAVPNHPRAIQKFLNAAPKPSWTDLHVQSLEYLGGGNLPVTRVQLVPHTGRTHQLRVHTAAALGYPIVGDDIYGYAGEGQGYGTTNSGVVPDPQHEEIQRKLYELQLPLCLHAHRLSLFHPISRAPMVFQCDAYF